MDRGVLLFPLLDLSQVALSSWVTTVVRVVLVVYSAFAKVTHNVEEDASTQETRSVVARTCSVLRHEV